MLCIALCGVMPIMVMGCEIEDPKTTTTPVKSKQKHGKKHKKTVAAKTGDSIDLQAQSGVLRVRTIKITRLTPPRNSYETAPEGMEYVGVGMSIRNDGDKTYTDAVSNGAQLILADGSAGETAIVSDMGCDDAGFGSDLVLPAGAERKGCLAFTVPKGAGVKQLIFRPDSGYSDSIGVWDLR